MLISREWLSRPPQAVAPPMGDASAASMTVADAESAGFCALLAIRDQTAEQDRGKWLVVSDLRQRFVIANPDVAMGMTMRLAVQSGLALVVEWHPVWFWRVSVVFASGHFTTLRPDAEDPSTCHVTRGELNALKESRQ